MATARKSIHPRVARLFKKGKYKNTYLLLDGDGDCSEEYIDKITGIKFISAEEIRLTITTNNIISYFHMPNTSLLHAEHCNGTLKHWGIEMYRLPENRNICYFRQIQ